MTLPVLTVVADGADWEAALVAAWGSARVGVTVVRRCTGAAELLAVASTGVAAAAVLPAGLAHLDRPLLTRLTSTGVAVVGVVEPDDVESRERLRALGIGYVVPSDASPSAVASALRAAVGALAGQRPGAPGAPPAPEPRGRGAPGAGGAGRRNAAAQSTGGAGAGDAGAGAAGSGASAAGAGAAGPSVAGPSAAGPGGAGPGVAGTDAGASAAGAGAGDLGAAGAGAPKAGAAGGGAANQGATGAGASTWGAADAGATGARGVGLGAMGGSGRRAAPAGQGRSGEPPSQPPPGARWPTRANPEVSPTTARSRLAGRAAHRPPSPAQRPPDGTPSAGLPHPGATPGGPGHSGASPGAPAPGGAAHAGAAPGGPDHNGAGHGGAGHGGAGHGGAGHGGTAPGGAGYGGAAPGGAAPGGAAHGGPDQGGTGHGGAAPGGPGHGGTGDSGAAHDGAAPGGAGHSGAIRDAPAPGGAPHGGVADGGAVHGGPAQSEQAHGGAARPDHGAAAQGGAAYGLSRNWAHGAPHHGAAQGAGVQRADATPHGDTTRHGETTASAAGDDDPPGRVVAIWGPAGAPGRSTVAVGLADEAARLGVATLLVDADTYGAALAQLLGLLDEASGLAAAARLADSGRLTPTTLATLARAVTPTLRVLTGLSRPDRWPEVGPDAMAEILVQARQLCPLTIVDCGFCLEQDEELIYDTAAPRRNGATLTALEAADTVLAIGAGDPVGLQRLIRGLASLKECLPALEPDVVVNKLRRGPIPGDPARQVADALERFAGVHGIRTLPYDRDAVDRALAEGRTLAETAEKSRLRRALTELATSVSVQFGLRGSTEE